MPFYISTNNSYIIDMSFHFVSICIYTSIHTCFCCWNSYGEGDLCFTMFFFVFFTKKWKWSYGRYTHSGIRFRPKTRKNDKFEKGLFHSKMTAQTRRLFFQKSCVWYLEVNIECAVYKIAYLTYDINYSIHKKVYLISRVLTRALYRVIILPCLFPCGAFAIGASCLLW